MLQTLRTRYGENNASVQIKNMIQLAYTFEQDRWQYETNLEYNHHQSSMTNRSVETYYIILLRLLEHVTICNNEYRLRSNDRLSNTIKEMHVV